MDRNLSSKINSGTPIFALKNVTKRFGHFQSLTAINPYSALVKCHTTCFWELDWGLAALKSLLSIPCIENYQFSRWSMPLKTAIVLYEKGRNVS
jgi:hypothetical protein